MEVQAFGKLKQLYDAMPAKNCWIAGGALRSFLVGDRVKDLDIFSSNPDEVLAAFEADASYKRGYTSDFVTNYHKDGFIYQVIKKYIYPTPEATIEAFDFTIVCAAISKDGIITHERFYADNAQKRLVVNNLPKPLSAMQRALKYSRRGYAICPIGLARILRAIQENPINWDSPDQNIIEFYPDGTPAFRGLD